MTAAVKANVDIKWLGAGKNTGTLATAYKISGGRKGKAKISGASTSNIETSSKSYHLRVGIAGPWDSGRWRGHVSIIARRKRARSGGKKTRNLPGEISAIGVSENRPVASIMVFEATSTGAARQAASGEIAKQTGGGMATGRRDWAYQNVTRRAWRVHGAAFQAAGREWGAALPALIAARITPAVSSNMYGIRASTNWKRKSMAA